MHYLILGGGFLGRRLPALLASGECCYITHRPETSVDHNPDGPTALQLDLALPESWNCLQQIKPGPLTVFCLIPPSRMELPLLIDFLQQLDELELSRAILCSSTVVYGREERTVDADSPVAADSARARRQLAIEQVWQSRFAERSRIVRLAGLYGPERIIGSHGMRAGKLVDGDPDAWLNLIHVEDAAALLSLVAGGSGAAAVELGADGKPWRRGDYYQRLAQEIGVEFPGFSGTSRSAEQPGGAGRCCDPAVTCERTGWQPVRSPFPLSSP